MLKPGWNILIFLIVMTIVMLMGTNCFKIASNLFMTSRMRYRYHQEVRLLEGLMAYGIQVCHENRSILLPWGAQKSQTMYMNFNPWPSSETQSIFGAHTGYITITSENGMLHLNAQLSRKNELIMAGACDVRSRDTKNPQGQVRVTNWQSGILP
jgi:hypothetical protein